MIRFSQLSVGLIALLFLAGCSGGDGGATLYPLTGQVRFDGNPLMAKPGETAFVELHPAPGNPLTVLPRSDIVAGKYEITTNGKPGVPVGSWLVRVVYQIEPDPRGPDPYAAPKALLHSRFGVATSSNLKVDVTPDGPGTQDFKVTH